MTKTPSVPPSPVTPASPSQGPTPVLPLEYESAGKKLYTVGTLTYTSSALVILFFWLLFGDFAISMRDRSVGPVVTKLLKIHEASDTVFAMLMAVLPPAISMVLGPIISYKSDRFRSRWGRRIPFLLIPTPIAVLSMFGLAASPQIGHWMDATLGARSPGYHPCVLILFAVFWTAFEFAVITAGAVLGGLINDVVPRQFLGRFFGLFRAVSLIAGMLFNKYIFGHTTTHFAWIFIGIGLLFGVGVTIMCLKVKEGDYPPPADHSDDPRAAGFVGAVRIYFRECFTKPYYLWVFAAMLVAGLTFAPFNTFSIPYKDALKISDQVYGDLLFYSYGTSLLLAYPLGWLVDKFHSIRIGLLALMLYAISVLYGSFFVRDTQTFAVAFIAHTVLSGTYFTATASMGQALFPKLKFGQFASAAGLVGSMGNITLGLAIGPILDHSDHNYKLTFVMGLILCVTAIGLMLVVYSRFMRLGGPKGYIAPDEDEVPPSHDGTTAPARGH